MRFWLASFIEIAIVFFLSILFTPVEKNVNCVFDSCINFISFGGIGYQAVWFLGIFSLILFTNYFLVRWFFEKS